MDFKVRAVYRDGTLVPEAPCDFPEGAKVDLLVRTSENETKDPGERARRMRTLTERMQQNPIPADAPRWTREELHERR